MQENEVTIDELPGLPPYCEIDCKTEKSLLDMIKKLNLDIKKKRYGSFGKTYLEYYGLPEEILNFKTPKLTFKNIKNEIKAIKNKKLLDKIAKKQKKY